MDNEYMRQYMAERYERRLRESIALLGGACVKCQSTNKLQFDHIDPTTKLFSICTRLAGISQAKLDAELAKCQLLCGDCHLEKSRAEGSLGNNATVYVCCGRTFKGRKSYAGHTRWHPATVR